MSQVESSGMSVETPQQFESESPREMVIAVVIPCYRVRNQIEGVLSRLDAHVDHVYCVDDACPENSAEIIEQCAQQDSRIQLLRHDENQGVGGAVLTGYRRAIGDGADVIVKMDGDGQMDPALIPQLTRPIRFGEADYVKGNRFFQLESVRSMPRVRLIGNIGLSFLTKISSGYWDLFDPTNGFTAIHADVARSLPLERISRRYFFESDMLFRLGTLRAVIVDVPMDAVYGDDQSSLNVVHSLFEFPLAHLRNTFKRLFYNYYLRNFSLASIQLVLGILLLTFGTTFGAVHWIRNAMAGQLTGSGTVMLAALPFILGAQLLLNFIAYDMANIPKNPIHRRLTRPIDSSAST